MNSKIDRVLDIFDPISKKFLRYEILDLFGPVISHWTYFFIIAAIPKLWKPTLKYANVDNVEPLDIPMMYDIIGMKQYPSRYIHWSALEKMYPIDNYIDTLKQCWSHDLQQISQSEWDSVFQEFLNHVRPVKLRYFQFRVLNRVLTTNVIRNKWHPQVSQLCSFCQEQPEIVVHLLCQCSKIKPPWVKLSKWCKYYMNINIMFDNKLIILNNYIGLKENMVNTLIIMLKQFIYASKCLNEQPSFTGFISKLSYWYHVEKQITYNKNANINSFYKKWCDMF